VAGGEDYDRLRPLHYVNTDAFVITHSVIGPASYENVRSKWVPELRTLYPDVPIVIVGTKTDLRDDPEVVSKLKTKGLSPTTFEMASKLARDLNLNTAVECSSLNGENVHHVFDTAINLASKHKADQYPHLWKEKITKGLKFLHILQQCIRRDRNAYGKRLSSSFLVELVTIPS
jgi:GTPase SAR1 family protein